jgi:purine nucleosidase
MALPGLIRAAAQRGAVTFVALGPLTNLALAIRLDPQLPELITRLVVMGGAVHGQGNSTPVAEFNFFADPESAAIVFGAGFAETWLLPWETSLRYTLPWDEYGRFCQLGTPHADLFRSITAFLAERGRQQVGLPGLPLPDLLAMAVAIHPAAATRVEQVYLQVDARPGPGYGQAIVDWFGLMGKRANVRIVEEVDHDFVFSFLKTALIE